MTSRTGLDPPGGLGSGVPFTTVAIRTPTAQDADGTVPGVSATDAEGGATGEATVPVSVTPALAAANDLTVGAPVSLAVWGSTIPGQVAQIVPGVPGTLDVNAVLLDATTVTAWAQQANRRIPPPDQLWIATDDPQATVAALAEVNGLFGVTGPGAVPVTDAAGAVRLVFWVASAGAVLLAITGIGAVATNLLRARRGEVAVLRALGMTPSAQARSRVTELLGVVVASAVAGLAAGWLVGRMVVPELARSTTLDGEVRLPAALRLELPVWSGLLGLLVAALAVVLLAQVWRVRAQALDRDYREEIR